METANYAPHIYNEYKTRNILNLDERVEVLREYDRYLTRPSLQSLAQKFNCSAKQIKNILLNRDSILKSYKNSEGLANNEANARDDRLQKRQEKIAFLGKVIYEFIQRALYYNYNLDDEKVRQKAMQITECIAVENFQPTYAWLENFKRLYGIPSFDLASLRNNIVITEVKRPHMSAIDMIQYVSRMEQKAEAQNSTNVNTNNNNNNNNKTSSNNINNNNRLSITDNNHNSLEPKIIYEIEDEEEEDDEELQKLNSAATTHNKLTSPSSTANNSPQSLNVNNKRRASSPFPDIESVDEALKHIKVLEEYAMLHDNFRAIGLLTQLEQIFKKQVKN